MRLKAVALGVGAALIAVATLSAQAKPNFTGKWTLVPDPNAAAAATGGGGRMAGGGGFGGGFSCGAECTMTQDATSLKIERTTQAGATTMTVKLDGTDTKNTMNMGANPMDIMLKGKWDGAKLVVSSSMSFNGTPITSDTTLSMDGASLVIESKRPGRNGGEPTVTKQTYKKN